jgi:FADH2 O2-dependent halogenase
VKADFDIAVIGSGFAGSLMAMIARRLGRSVALLERGRHPRFVIGESSTPLTNLLWEELCRQYALPSLAPLAKWGTWQRAHPEIACGLKRGFTFYHHRRGERFAADPERRDQLLVAASPHDDVADTHWYRPDFDHFLVEQAQHSGAVYLDETSLCDVRPEPGRLALRGTRGGQPLEITVRFVVDASGPRGFLTRALGLAEAAFPALPATEALFTHFTNVRRLDGLADFQRGGAGPDAAGAPAGPPYPVDDAAVHHVFEGGWIWVLRFNNGVTSAGAALTRGLATALRLAEGGPAWERLLEQLPSVREQFAAASPVLGWCHLPRLSFRSAQVTGERWALVPSAAGFVDPLLSTGFPLTLLGLGRLAAALGEDWETPRLARRLAEYGRQTLAELDTTALLIAALYRSLGDFELFAALTLLYFAAASYSESARRLGRPELASGFLLHDHPQFGEALRRCCAAALELAAEPKRLAAAKSRLLATIHHAIEPVDVAGLSRADRRHWFPVDAQDFLASAAKLGAREDEVLACLRRSGFFR